MRAHRPIIKIVNHLVSVVADVRTWFALLLRTDFEVAPPKEQAIKIFAYNDPNFCDEKNFSFYLWHTGLLLRLSIPIVTQTPKS